MLDRLPHQPSELRHKTSGTRNMPELHHGAPSGLMGSSEQDEAFASESPSDGGITIANLLPRLLRAKWLIIGVFMLVSLVAVPILWMTHVPMFKATALARVAPVVSRIVFQTEANTALPMYWSFFGTQIWIIRSPTVLECVLDREDVRQTSWYAEIRPSTVVLPGSADYHALADSLTVQQREKTELIEVSMVARNPGDAKVIANAVVEEYKRVSEEVIQQIDARRRRTLRDESRGLKNQLDGLHATKQELLERTGRVDSKDVRTALYTEFLRLETEHESLRRESVLVDMELQVLQRTDKKSDSKDEPTNGVPVAGRYYPEVPEWRHINLELQNRRHDLEVALQRLGTGHPRIKQLTGDVEYTGRLLRECERELDVRWKLGIGSTGAAPGDALAQGDRTALERLRRRQAKELELRQNEIDLLKVRIAEAGDVSLKAAHFDEDIFHNRELYSAVRKRLDELQMEAKAPARISIASYAIEPSKPIEDRRVRLTAAILAGALVAGLAMAMLFTSVDPTIREQSDVRSTCCAPFLGQLPSLQNDIDLLTDCTPMLIEGIRMVRTALLRRVPASGRHVILVTSSSSQSGKTSVAILLARSLALLGKKTLLVETDLRRPSLSQRLELDSPVGLASLLTGQAQEEKAIVSSGVVDFDVLLAGESPPEFNAELLANGVFSACLERWKQRYDFVVLDSPPVLPVADARILAGQADGTIMILRAAHTRRMEVVQAYADLSAAGARLLGTILVGVDSLSGGDYYSDYLAEVPRIESDEITVGASST